MKKKIGNFFRANREAINSRAGKIGGYSVILTLIVLAIIIALNVVVRMLPSKMTQYDISAVRLYSLTSNSKVVVKNLKKKVTIYWITQNGKEDEIIERILNVYDDLSDKISLEKKNPDVYPTFAQKYTDETVSNNSIVVECGDRFRYIAYDELYEVDYSNAYGYDESYSSQPSTSFDGEGQITSAINYVVNEDLPKVFLLTGHGETDLSDALTKALNKQNVETEELSLLNQEDSLKDCDGLIINSPASDLSEKEVGILEEYLDDGGHLLVMAGPQEEDRLEHLESLLDRYDIQANEGIVIEGDTEHYAFGMPYLLLADLGDSDITEPLINENKKVIMPITQGLSVRSTGEESGITVTELLTTSEDSYSKKKGYNIETYEKEKGDIDGPFAAAVSVEDSMSSARMVWIASANMTEDTYDSYSSGANCDFVMNALSWMIGEEDSISIRSKSLDYNYLSISESQASIIKLFLIGIIPAGYLLFGVDEVLKRRKRRSS